MIDVLVAGGGPAGLATAIGCAQAGLPVTVAEPREGPIGKACGEGLMLAAVRLLAAIGVRPEGRPLNGIRYLDSRGGAAARFRHGCGLGARRAVLLAALASRAAQPGIPVLPVRVTAFAQDGNGVTAADLRARCLVAAADESRYTTSGAKSAAMRMAGRPGGSVPAPGRSLVVLLRGHLARLAAGHGVGGCCRQAAPPGLRGLCQLIGTQSQDAAWVPPSDAGPGEEHWYEPGLRHLADGRRWVSGIGMEPGSAAGAGTHAAPERRRAPGRGRITIREARATVAR